NALFIMTSNLGSEELIDSLKKHPKQTKESILKVIDPILRRHFKPEFLNRLDEILPFLPLQEKDMEQIVKIQIDRVADRLKEKHIHLDVSKEVLTHLAELGYDPLFGARPLKRTIQSLLVNPLATSLLEGKIHPNKNVEIEMKKGEIIINQK
ncbi:MAG TPA: AAA family ATPase, partial [Chlamydiales bacterium]|nr:AAA family ATPase [Chlamydiales bacterium]